MCRQASNNFEEDLCMKVHINLIIISLLHADNVSLHVIIKNVLSV